MEIFINKVICPHLFNLVRNHSLNSMHYYEKLVCNALDIKLRERERSYEHETSQQEGLIIALSKCVKTLTMKKLLKFSIEISQNLCMCLNGRFSKIWSHVVSLIRRV